MPFIYPTYCGNLHVITMPCYQLACSSPVHALRVRVHGMDDASLQTIYRSVIIAKLTYASSAWWWYTSATDRQRLEAFIRRSDRSGFVPANLPTFAELCLAADEKLFETVIPYNNQA